MKWEGNGEYAIKSGDYIVTKNENSQGWQYSAWRKPAEHLGNFATAAEAKAACVAMATTLDYPRAKS